MPDTDTTPRISPQEALQILEDAYAYYTPLPVLVTGKPETPEYYGYIAAA
ncbi:hypothetical protein SAMN05444722_1955 [Rhodovulum sp. ES.010]|nr:hypothetical protein [Rhodovulum sp. ES.010]SIO40893.1 hypothetical protein SAMN05444722_1955 [Rhodovulum sp. ES.010]